MEKETTRGRSQDRLKVNLSEDYEVQYWTNKFGVTEQQLKEAVKNSGSMARDVEAYLKGKNK